MTQQLVATAERLANAAEALDRVLGRIDAQQEALNAKVDRIVAAVEERAGRSCRAMRARLRRKLANERVAELEKTNTELKAQAARFDAENFVSTGQLRCSARAAEIGDKVEVAVLDKTLQSLTVEQRIAVKAEMARAGMIE